MVKRRKRDFTFHTPSPPPCFQDGIVLLVIMLAFQEQALKFDWLFCFNVAFSLAGNLKSDRLFCLSVAFSLAGKKIRFKRFIKEYIAQLSHQQFKNGEIWQLPIVKITYNLTFSLHAIQPKVRPLSRSRDNGRVVTRKTHSNKTGRRRTYLDHKTCFPREHSLLITSSRFLRSHY